jgi:KTSC domain
MQRQWVNSSDLQSVGYEDGILEIKFHSGDVYHYSNVPENIFVSLMNASSKGQYFNAYIKGSYAYRRIA